MEKTLEKFVLYTVAAFAEKAEKLAANRALTVNEKEYKNRALIDNTLSVLTVVAFDFYELKQNNTLENIRQAVDMLLEALLCQLCNYYNTGVKAIDVLAGHEQKAPYIYSALPSKEKVRKTLVKEYAAGILCAVRWEER